MTARSPLALFAAIMLAGATPAATFAQQAAPPNPRIALVIGELTYGDQTLATPVNDAALIAQTLEAAGFDVVGARDLDGKAVRAAMRDFLDKAAAVGPDMQAFVYLAGRAVQYEGDNFFVPVDAQLGARLPTRRRRRSGSPTSPTRSPPSRGARASWSSTRRGPIPIPARASRLPAASRWSIPIPASLSLSTPRRARSAGTNKAPTASTPSRWPGRCAKAACRSRTSSPRRASR